MVIINIDTSKDSKEEIRQTIRYLQSIVDDTSSSADSGFVNPFAEPTPAEDRSDGPSAAGGMLGMFDNPLARTSDASETSASENPDEEQLDAASLLKESDDFIEVHASGDEDDDDVEVVDDQKDVFIEIVEYE